VYVFVAISRRLGVAASPVNFPGRVIAHVSSPLPTVSDIYVDVFASDTHPIISVRDDIPNMLRRAGVPPAAMAGYLSPGRASRLLLRAAQNILHSDPGSGEELLEVELEAANYAVACIHLLFMNEQQLIAPMMSHILVHSLEAATVLSNIMIPRLQGPAKVALAAKCEEILKGEEEAATKVHLRSLVSAQIKFYVGTVFQHKAYDYIGCIIGWEV
jgi:F-box protein 21